MLWRHWLSPRDTPRNDAEFKTKLCVKTKEWIRDYYVIHTHWPFCLREYSSVYIYIAQRELRVKLGRAFCVKEPKHAIFRLIIKFM
jgi:hypothetical protein